MQTSNSDSTLSQTLFSMRSLKMPRRPSSVLIADRNSTRSSMVNLQPSTRSLRREGRMNELSEAHMDYGLGELYVPEVSWACRGGVPAGFAFLTGFEGSESAVH